MHKKLVYRTTDYFFNYGTFVYPKRKIIILYIHFDFHCSGFRFFQKVLLEWQIQNAFCRSLPSFPMYPGKDPEKNSATQEVEVPINK